jgi:hypothetical protein
VVSQDDVAQRHAHIVQGLPRTGRVQIDSGNAEWERKGITLRPLYLCYSRRLLSRGICDGVSVLVEERVDQEIPIGVPSRDLCQSDGATVTEIGVRFVASLWTYDLLED